MTGGADMRTAGRVVALCGGVGGAKLAAGLAARLGDRLAVIVNTGDDFEHLGLKISPDIDTVLYTLSGLANRQLGWGRGDESWNFIDTLGRLGGETWFQLGDRDLALHVLRTVRLGAGESLTDCIAHLRHAMGIAPAILPMSDAPVRTMVVSGDRTIPFQQYFVRERCAPRVDAITFTGADRARPSAAVRAALADPGLGAVVICPSNPYLSIDPLLAVPGMRDLIGGASAPVIAVSPLIGGRAVKGPTDKIMAELGLPATTASVAAHYADLIDGLVIDAADADGVPKGGPAVLATPTLMRNDDDRVRLADAVLRFAATLGARAAGDAVRP